MWRPAEDNYDSSEMNKFRGIRWKSPEVEDGISDLGVDYVIIILTYYIIDTRNIPKGELRYVIVIQTGPSSVLSLAAETCGELFFQGRRDLQHPERNDTHLLMGILTLEMDPVQDILLPLVAWLMFSSIEEVTPWANHSTSLLCSRGVICACTPWSEP